jgi:pSer/pThr/pTyr-binding forkhead associated (FHA) protein
MCIDGAGLSERHAEIKYDHGKYLLRDMNSESGKKEDYIKRNLG